MYLSEKLADLATKWKAREELTTRAQNMLRIDNDIKSLQNFATRAYTNELGVQKTVLRDLLGGKQCSKLGSAVCSSTTLGLTQTHRRSKSHAAG